MRNWQDGTKLALVGRLLQLFSRHERWQLIGLAMLMGMGAALELLGIGVIVPFIGVLGKPELVDQNRWLSLARDYSGAASAREFLLFLGMALLGLFVVKNAYLALLVYLQNRFALDKQTALAKRLFEAYMRNPYTFHLQHNTAILLRNINGEVQGLVNGVAVPSLLLLNELLVFSAVVLMLLMVEPYVALTALAVIGSLALLTQQIVKPVLNRYGRGRVVEGGEMNKWVSQGLGGVKEAKVLGREEFFVEAHHASSVRYARSTLFFSVLIAAPRLFIETLAVAGMLIVVIVMLMRGSDLADTLPVLALFAVAAIRLIPSITRMFSAISSVRFYYPAVIAVAHDLEVAESPRAPILTAATVGTVAPLRLRERITLDGVWFRYPGSEGWTLKGISCSISKGASVALVGASGAGKSTLVDILLGLLSPETGRVLIDETDLRDIVPRWQRSLGYVPQAIYLLDDTLRRNVAFGIPDGEIDDARVWRVLRIASLEEKARELPQGLDTPVGERGTRLSGGERQRVGIARALYHEPEVIVFDEATSSLDATTGHTVTQAIDALTGSKTVIVIAHSLSTVQHCDRLIFMKDGAIAAAGTFSELLASSTEFAALVRNQTLFAA